jgi:hypothetical protein
MVASEVMNARAICAVDIPVSVRSISATRASIDSAGVTAGEDQPQAVVGEVGLVTVEL